MRGRAVGYVRVGKKDEDSYQYLAGKQIDLIASWAADNEADVFDWFFDIGVEPAEPLQLRSGGQGLLDRLGRGGLDFVIVASLEALGKGQTLFDALQLVMGSSEETGVAAVLPSARSTSGLKAAKDHLRPLEDEGSIQKAA